MELEVVLPREVVKSKDLGAVEQALTRVLERYPTLDQAQQSEIWNEREIEPYPEDYDRTLAELTVWKAEQRNALVENQRARAMTEVSRLTDRIGQEADYLAGFASGVEDAGTDPLDDCSELVAYDIEKHRKRQAGKKGEDGLRDRGYEDGLLLVHGLEMVRDLPGCLVPVPELLAELPAED